MFAFGNSELEQTLKISDIHWKLDDSGKVLNLVYKRKNNSFTFIFGDDQGHSPLAVYSGNLMTYHVYLKTWNISY